MKNLGNTLQNMVWKRSFSSFTWTFLWGYVIHHQNCVFLSFGAWNTPYWWLTTMGNALQNMALKSCFLGSKWPFIWMHVIYNQNCVFQSFGARNTILVLNYFGKCSAKYGLRKVFLMLHINVCMKAYKGRWSPSGTFFFLVELGS